LSEVQESSSLTNAAKSHALDLSVTWRNSHVSSDGSSYEQRIEKEGQWSGRVGENIYTGK